MSDLFHPFRGLPRYRESGDGFTALCPCHDERTPSFQGKLKGTRLMLLCRSCGAKAGAILTALGFVRNGVPDWGLLFSDSPRAGEVRQARSESALLAAWRERELVAACTALRERDAVIQTDWSEYEGETLESVLSQSWDGYWPLQDRFELLRVGTTEECRELYRKESA